MIKAILMDLDGILIDMCEAHYISLNLALSSCAGFQIGQEEHLSIFNGLTTKTKLDILVKQGRLSQDQADGTWYLKQAFTKQAIEEKFKLDNEKIALHKEIKKLGIKVACVTNSIRETAILMLEKTGQLEFMEFVITNEDVSLPKPDSEGYITAMKRLGLDPIKCLIVEDSPKGLLAAYNSGANVLEVKNPTEVAEKVWAYLLMDFA